MNAVILAHAGIALLLDGDEYFALDGCDSSLEKRPLKRAEVPSLILGRRDLQFVENVNLSEVRHELLASWNKFRALDLILIALDGEAQWTSGERRQVS